MLKKEKKIDSARDSEGEQGNIICIRKVGGAINQNSAYCTFTPFPPSFHPHARLLASFIIARAGLFGRPGSLACG